MRHRFSPRSRVGGRVAVLANVLLLLLTGMTWSSFSTATGNAANAFEAAAVFPPADVTGVSATSGEDAQVPVSWSAANRAVDYEVRYRVIGAPSWSGPAVTAATAVTVTGLANGSMYEFQV